MSQKVREQDKLLHATLFTFFVSGVCAQSLGNYIPFFKEAYGFQYAFSGILLACHSVGNLAAVALAGFLPAYLGRRKSIFITSIWMAAAYAIFAAGIGSPLLVAAACTMTGIARGGNTNFSNTMISTLPDHKTAKAYQLLHGCFAVGALLAPLLLVASAALWGSVGWRMMAGGQGLLCLVQIFVYMKMPLPSESVQKGLRAVDKGFLRSRSFWMGSAMLFFYISAEYAIVGWLVTYFQDVGILSDSISQMMNSLLWLVIFIGRMLGAALTDKLSRRTLLTINGLGFFAFFLFLFFSRTPATVVAGVMGVGLFMSTIYPAAFAFGSESVKGNDFGCSLMTLTGSVGGILTPALVGFVAEKAGMQAGMVVVGLSTAMLLLSILYSVKGEKTR